MVFICSCSTDAEENSGKMDISIPGVSPESNLNATGTVILTTMIKDYYGLKNAMVTANAQEADVMAGRLMQSCGKMAAFMNTDTNHKPAILQPYLDTIVAASGTIVQTNDESCELKRIPFGTISECMYRLLKAAGMKHASIYRHYCPMVFNDKGASWLSKDVKIKNPYFGKKLLECGETIDSFTN